MSVAHNYLLWPRQKPNIFIQRVLFYHLKLCYLAHSLVFLSALDLSEFCIVDILNKFLICIFFKFLFIYFERKGEHERGRGREKEEREFQAGSALPVEPDAELELTNLVRSRPEWKSRVRA